MKSTTDLLLDRSLQRSGVSDGDVEWSDDPSVLYHRFLQAISQQYPSHLPLHTLWGFGRPLWDKRERRDGRKPIHVVVLGPPGSGKTTLAKKLSSVLDVPCFTLGQILQKEMMSKYDHSMNDLMKSMFLCFLRRV